jgi:hypothetical protein
VNEEYLEYLLELDKKLKFVHEDEVARMSQATRDLEPALEKLRLKALSKVSEAAACWSRGEKAGCTSGYANGSCSGRHR